MESEVAVKQESSLCFEPEYDPATKTLTVQFKKGGTYHYADFPEDKAAEFLAAPSYGKFYHGNKHLFTNGHKA